MLCINVFRSQSLRLGACNAVYYSKLEIPLGERNGSDESSALIHDKHEAFSSSYELPWNFPTGRRSLSSDAGARSSGEEDEIESLELQTILVVIVKMGFSLRRSCPVMKVTLMEQNWNYSLKLVKHREARDRQSCLRPLSLSQVYL